MKFDVFIPLHPRHFDVIGPCIESLRTHLGDQIHTLTVVAGELPPSVQTTLTKLGVTFLNEREPLGFSAVDLPPTLKAQDDGGQLFSQILKWELRRYASTPNYLVVDADVILLQPLKLDQDSLPILLRQNRYRFPHIMCFNWCFGLIPNAITPFANDLVIMNVKILDEMTTKIQGRFNLPWHRALLQILQQVKGTNFSFSEIYGYFAALNHPNSFISQTLRTRQLPLTKLTSHANNVRQSQNGNATILRYSTTEAQTTPAKPVIRMATLTHNGRFANQVFQYAFLQLYAKQHQLAVECPPWVGNGLFGHQETLSDRLLPLYREDKGETEEPIRFNESHPMRDFELWGYFQETDRWRGNETFFRSLFQPLPFIRKPIDDALARVRAGGRTLVAIHLRRGDFQQLGGSTFWPAPEAWYLRWLANIWPTLNNPVLYVATDDPAQVLPHFQEYDPVSDKQLGVTLKGAEFYVDFHVLSQCDVLAISNSTFSFAAAMLNDRAQIMTRPEPYEERMIDFNPWNSPVLLKYEPADEAIASDA